MIKVIVMGNKLNVVDNDNNFVGFDMEDDCCAEGGYFISETKCEKDFTNQIGIIDKEFPFHIFDRDFFEFIDRVESHSEGAVIFKMRPDYDYEKDGSTKELFLHLFNVHNGYYSKGFKYSFGEITKTGSV